MWVVSVPPDVACERVMKRNSLPKEKALERIQSQMSNEERESHGNLIIRFEGVIVTKYSFYCRTNQPIEITNQQIERHYRELRARIEKQDGPLAHRL